MDFVKNLAGGNTNNNTATTQSTSNASGQQSSGGFMDKLNGMAGGGPNSEKNEDYLDKGE